MLIYQKQWFILDPNYMQTQHLSLTFYAANIMLHVPCTYLDTKFVELWLSAKTNSLKIFNRYTLMSWN